MAFRRANRQIEVFDISLMAVVTKAMGAFLVLMLLLLPYYRSNPAYQGPATDLSRQLADLAKQMEEMRKNLGTAGQTPADLRAQLDAARQQLAAAEETLQKLRKQLDVAWSQLQQAQDQSKQLTAENAALEQRNSDLASRLAAAQSQVAALQQQTNALASSLDEARSRAAAAAAQAQQSGGQASDLGNALNQAEPQIHLIVSTIYKVEKACGDSIGMAYDFDLLDQKEDPTSQTVIDRASAYVEKLGAEYTSVGAPFYPPAQPVTDEAILREFVFRSSSTDRRYYFYAYRQPDRTIGPNCLVSMTVNVLEGPRAQGTLNGIAVPDAAARLLLVLDMTSSPAKVRRPIDDDEQRFAASLVRRKEIAEKIAARHTVTRDRDH